VLSNKSLIIKSKNSLYCLTPYRGKWIFVKAASDIVDAPVETGDTVYGDELLLSYSGIVLNNGDIKVASTSRLIKVPNFKFETENNSIYAINPILDAKKFLLTKIDGINSLVPTNTNILGNYIKFRREGFIELYDEEGLVFNSSNIARFL
jgi:hypothetical protein